MYKVIQNEKMTEKTLTESCCTQKWERSNLSVLQIKMVLSQGCTQNICSFLRLVVHKLLQLKWCKSQWFSVAALQIPLREEYLPVHNEQWFFFSALWWVRLPYGFSSILCMVLSSFSTMMSLAGGNFFFFLKLRSSDFEKQDVSLPCSLEN